MQHKTFLNHFVISLAIAAGFWVAWLKGIPQLVYTNDLSHMTTAILILFIITVVWLGWQAWLLGDNRWYVRIQASSSFGHLAEKLSPAFGLAGTTIGLSLQGQALMGGAAAFGALATSLYTTATGIVGLILIAILLYNLDEGIKKNEKR